MEVKEEIKMLRTFVADLIDIHKTEMERVNKLEEEIAILKGERIHSNNSGTTNTTKRNTYMKILKKIDHER